MLFWHRIKSEVDDEFELNLYVTIADDGLPTT